MTDTEQQATTEDEKIAGIAQAYEILTGKEMPEPGESEVLSRLDVAAAMLRAAANAYEGEFVEVGGKVEMDAPTMDAHDE